MTSPDFGPETTDADTTNTGLSTSSVDAGPLPGPGFLSARGDQLYLRGQPYRFLSFNSFSLTGCGSEIEQFDAQTMQEFFASLRPNSLVRTHAFQSTNRAAIESTIIAAKDAGHLLNLVLADHNGSCGDGGQDKTEQWYSSEFRDGYLPWVVEIVTQYRDEPAVGMWELVAGPANVPPATLRAFYDEVGGRIKQLDSNHLISSGTHGPWAYGADGYALLHESAFIDVAGFRDYDQNDGPPPNLRTSLNALGDLQKPLILAEAGVFASREGDPTQSFNGQACLSWGERQSVFETWIEESFKTRLAGINVWNFLPAERQGCQYSTYIHDPLFDVVRDTALP